MQQTACNLLEIMLVGISAITSNQAEMNPETAKIPATIQRYFQSGINTQTPHRTHPGTTYCVYTNYASDVNGDYTYFVGEQVSSFEGVSPELTTITIPAQHYQKFTAGPGSMPIVCIDAWQKIWHMSPEQLDGQRAFIADFEVYDQRSIDPQNTTLDIYIGVQK